MSEFCKLLIVVAPFAFAIITMWLLGGFYDWPSKDDKEPPNA